MRQFSCPDAGFDEAVSDAILLSHGTAVLDRFRACHGEALDAASDGLIDALRSWSGGGLTRADALALPLGEAATAVAGRHDAPVRVAADLGLQAMLRGLPSRWLARLEGPAVLRFGPWRLPEATAVGVDGDGRHAQVDLETPDGMITLAFEREDARWSSRNGDIARSPRLGDLEVLSAEDVSPHLRNLSDFRGCRPVDRVTPAAADGLSDALGLLGSAGQAWETWLARMVRHVLLLDAGEGSRSKSGSSSDAPGVIALSLAHPLRTAEMLVHESSHLYFHMAELVGPVDDGSDRRLYYSPAVRRDRPLNRVLIAYHAFGNVLVFYRALLDRGVDVGGLVAREAERLTGEVAQLEAPLRGNSALTEVGHALFAPLSERLEATA